MADNREAELKAMTLADLKELAEGDYDLEINGLKKADLIKAIINHEEADDEVDDEIDDELDEEDDEVDDSEEDEVDDDDEVDDEEPEPEPEPKKSTKKKAKKSEDDGEATLAAKQVAALLNTDAKTLRQFFRSPASTTEAVGSGGRYEFLESDVDKIRNEFASWMENKTTRTRTKTEGGTKRKRKEKVIAEEEIAPEIEELDDELDELEDELDDELDD